MARKFLTAIKLLTGSTPPTGTAGDTFFSTDSKALQVHDGTSWVNPAIKYQDTQPTNAAVGDIWVESDVDVPAATYVTLTDTQTLTNKTLTSPVVTGGTLNGGGTLTVDSTELNVLDGLTASTAELNILDGVTSSTAELNILDGATLSTTELNYVDGVTSAIQTQIDLKAPKASPVFTGSGTVNSGRLGAVIGGLGNTTSGANLTVTHGLGITPTAVTATIRINTYTSTNNANIYVGNIGATTFTVFANNGAGGVVTAAFAWIAVG